MATGFRLKEGLGLTAACLAATLYGFVPTGVVALALASRAAAVGRSDPSLAARRRRSAERWLIATLLIGAAVELPVIAAAIA